jgi:hypothetical protein
MSKPKLWSELMKEPLTIHGPRDYYTKDTNMANRTYASYGKYSIKRGRTELMHFNVDEMPGCCAFYLVKHFKVNDSITEYRFLEESINKKRVDLQRDFIDMFSKILKPKLTICNSLLATHHTREPQGDNLYWLDTLKKCGFRASNKIPSNHGGHVYVLTIPKSPAKQRQF